MVKPAKKHCRHRSCTKKRHRNKCRSKTSPLLRYFQLWCPCFCSCQLEKSTPICCKCCPYKENNKDKDKEKVRNNDKCKCINECKEKNKEKIKEKTKEKIKENNQDKCKDEEKNKNKEIQQSQVKSHYSHENVGLKKVNNYLQTSFGPKPNSVHNCTQNSMTETKVAPQKIQTICENKSFNPNDVKSTTKSILGSSKKSEVS